jgi:PelA/Pel-15E family pectate lyase
MKLKCLSLVLLIPLFVFSQSRQANINVFDPKPFADAAHHWYDIAEKGMVVHPIPNQPKYALNELEKIGDNILLYQKTNGGWPKNYDVTAILTSEQKDSLQQYKTTQNTTFDNGTTYTHVQALGKIYTATKLTRFKTAALAGLDFILSAQYDNGGWPQSYPLAKDYSRHITYNDGVMAGIMRMLREIKEQESFFSFIDTNRLTKAKEAFAKGVDCILKTQIIDNGKPTAWCQQHDAVTLEPTWARKFEPPSICNGESCEIVELLMSIDQPSTDVKSAIVNAVNWFNESKILNTRVKTIRADNLDTPYRLSTTDRVVIIDSTAPPIWTRYYELKTHRPLFCNRDSKVVYSLAEVDRERRDGYAWYTFAPQRVLALFPSWKSKWMK